MINELSDYIDGYPPVAYFCARLASQYGVENLVSDKSLLVDFKARKFTVFLRELQLDDSEWLLLQYLASEQLVPLAAITSALDLLPEAVAKILRN